MGQRGGRPSIVFYSEDISGGASRANKTSYSPTIIAGSTASGDPLPVHFQLKTLAQTDAGQKLNISLFEHAKDVNGKYGWPDRRSFPCTWGLNEKAGMNSVEVDKYLTNSILPLYPDVEDQPRKRYVAFEFYVVPFILFLTHVFVVINRVIIKVDSGPGRTNLEMLAYMRAVGVYCYPGVPNTTHVSQETDQNYGVFKSVFRDNLEILSQARFDINGTLQITDLPLLVFGGTDALTNVVIRDSFSSAFSVDANISC